MKKIGKMNKSELCDEKNVKLCLEKYIERDLELLVNPLLNKYQKEDIVEDKLLYQSHSDLITNVIIEKVKKIKPYNR